MTVDQSRLEAWRASQARRVMQQQSAAGASGGGGPPFGTNEIMDAKIAASEARTDTKFAELRGDLSKFATKNTVWGAVGTALGIVLAVAALAGNRFDAGMTVRAATESVLVAQQNRDKLQDRKLDEILLRLPKKDSQAEVGAKP